jgi:amidophosphoribosyltransferase
VALSGRFSNGAELRKELQQQGSMLRTNSDAELLALLISRSDRNTPVNRIVDALWRVEGGYVAMVLSKERLVAVRDPRGFRPLVLGRVDEGWVIASEDGAIRAMGGWVERVIEPGEMVILDRKGRRVVRPFPKRATSACIHELVSVARPDTRLFGQDVHQMRVAFGAQLAKESGSPKDGVVVGLPDGSQAAAVGYAREASLPYEPGLMLTDEGTWLAVPGVVRERKVVLVSGHLATGRAVRRGVHLLREAGAKEVHVRVASPAARAPCPYGLSSPMRDELAMARHENPAKLATRMGSDDVRCLSHDALLAVASQGGDEGSPFCSMCLGGSSPLSVEEMDEQLPLF